MDKSTETQVNISIIPKKRILRSMATDLDYKKALLEMIDNSIDSWNRTKPNQKLIINIKLDKEKNSLYYRDNAGGVKESDIARMFTLGENSNGKDDATIGEFGVGLKRSLFVLAKKFEIRSRSPGELGFRTELDVEKYFDDENWEIIYYKGANLDEGETEFEFTELTFEFPEKAEREFRKLIAETYAYSFSNNGEIFINDNAVKFSKFEEWSKFDSPYEK
ncbi:ATP-binding protein [Caldiplasma sukawensis]